MAGLEDFNLAMVPSSLHEKRESCWNIHDNGHGDLVNFYIGNFMLKATLLKLGRGASK